MALGDGIGLKIEFHYLFAQLAHRWQSQLIIELVIVDY